MEAAHRQLLHWASLVFTLPVVLYAAVPFFDGALKSVLSRRLSMDVPVATAIAVATLVSIEATVSGVGAVYYDSVVMFAFLLLTARYLDRRLRGRLDASASLVAALPDQCSRFRGDTLETVPRSAIGTGDSVWATPDNRLPADGVLEDEAAWVDESLLTGESEPVAKRRGDVLYAGTLVSRHGLRMKVSRVGSSTRLAAIEALAEQAELAKPRLTAAADRIVRVFVAAVLGCAALTYVAWSMIAPETALSSALAVLVISCPCALALAVPAAVTATLVRLRNLGALVFDADAVERLAGVDRLLVDKTGTLTTRTPELAAATCFDVATGEADTAPEAATRTAALARSLQRHSTHPLADALLRALPAVPDVNLADVTSVTGGGVKARHERRDVRIGSAAFCGIDSTAEAAKSIYLTVDGALAARYDVVEALLPDARETVAALVDLGIGTQIVSGDSAAACAPVARTLGVTFDASQSPEMKLERVDDARRAGHRVITVGDGINDGPFLAAADVSVAVLETPDSLRERADVLLLTKKLASLPALVRTARFANRIVRQNLTWALGYNLVAIPAAAFGWVPPWAAAAGMATSSIAVMLNATRVLRPPREVG